MLTILSPAKKLLTNHLLTPTPISTPTTSIEPLKLTTPIFQQKTIELVTIMKTMSSADIAILLHISKDLALLNYQRYQAFDCGNPVNTSTCPAVLLFRGDVYQSLCAASWDTVTHAFAGEHLLILSGLYGLLKPLDQIQAYRLEMGTRLTSACGKNLYDFWRTDITNELNNRLAQHKTPVLINLASQEYALAVSTAHLKFPMLTIHFKEKINNQLKTIGIFSKKARGAMAKYMMQHKIDSPLALKKFSGLGYRFCDKSSCGSHYHFVRAEGN